MQMLIFANNLFVPLSTDIWTLFFSPPYPHFGTLFCTDLSHKLSNPSKETTKVKGTVVLMKKNFLDLDDVKASVVDRVDEILGHKVSLQLISAVNADPGTL